ncbi:helix-turn-helix domain-containing protein [Sphingorhabdus sp.]|uniref:helix-turn-helix domain-containing protein n=1 Tax=Sphingorhabdus sp. TaxID=1902408 RepID=UPI00391BDD1E
MNPRLIPPAPIDQALAYTINDAARVSGLGRTTLYKLAGEGKIELRKIGARSIITASSLRALIEGEPQLEAA